MRAVGAGGGHAAAFTYDLARRVAYLRQGNLRAPAPSRRRRRGPIPAPSIVLRAPAADWLDRNPAPSPRPTSSNGCSPTCSPAWRTTAPPAALLVLPARRRKAVIAMTGDDHGERRHQQRLFDTLLALGPAGCRPPQLNRALVDSWACPRATSYVYPDNTPIDPGVAGPTGMRTASRSPCIRCSRGLTARAMGIFTAGLPERDALKPRGGESSRRSSRASRRRRPPAPTASSGATGTASQAFRTSLTGSGSTPTTTTSQAAWTQDRPGLVHRVGHADALRGGVRLTDRRLPGDDLLR